MAKTTLLLALRMIFSENRFPLFGIMRLFPGQFLLDRRDQARIVGFHGGGKARFSSARHAPARPGKNRELFRKNNDLALSLCPFISEKGRRALAAPPGVLPGARARRTKDSKNEFDGKADRETTKQARTLS